MQQADDRGYSTHQAQLPPAQQPIYDRYDSRPQDNYGAPPPPPPQREDSGGFEDDRPPPPPAHRSRTGSNPAVYQQNMQTMRQDVLRNEAHRASASPASSSAAYPGRPTYKAADSAPGGLASAQYSIEQPPPPLHYSYDAGYDQSHRGMQATVEDVPESPESMNSYRRSIGGRQSLGQSQQQFDMDFAPTDSPAPLNIATRRGSNAGPAPEQSRYSTSPGMQDQPGYQASNGVYSTSPSQAAVQREPSEYSHHSNYGRHSEPTLPSYDSQRDQRDQRALTYRNEFEDTSNNYAAPPPPPVPAALVPGINPNVSQMSQELVRFGDDRSHHQRRYTQPAHNEVQPRGRTMDLSRRYDYDDTTANYNAPPPPVQHAKTYTNGMPRSDYNVVVRTRGQSPIPPPARDPSPNPPQQQHTIRRKSVSPRPPSSDSRAMSSVPFGPDSYDSLNPSVAAASNDLPDYDAATGKIITHDGREVDPSDHLPMDTWAPEPEPKKPTPAASPSGRPAPAGPQPLPPSGRRQLRIAARPQSMLPGTPNGGYSSADPYDTPSPPVSTGRNRLQKKPPPRTSTSALPAGVPMMSGANGPGPDAAPAYNSGFRRNSNVGMESTPLAPLPPHQDNFNAPRQLSRASTFDYVGGENYHPSMNGQRGGPPPPAKIPLALPPAQGYGHGGHNMSGAMQLHSSSAARRGGMDDYNDPYGHGGGGGTMDYGRDLSLEEELSQIDIGTGRSSRRHRHQGHAAHASAGGGYGGGHQGQW
ncbi:hypothetical protein QBC35DRAFT_497316 [Podospora australis]|uniref:Uncharacterized protein n=1 Tax=Podospora australis TaxID=1536484 RepID=A0AAN6WTX2_9PEZI|nr:hypothetical protein QBC35DRAFT_497316 [Podospora australis]